MHITETQLRVRYAETDQMGYVYYGNYATYYEVARADAMRTLEMTYRQMEEKGVFMPIVSMQSKFIRPAHYDDLLTIRTIVKELPSTRMHFLYEVFNDKGTLLNIGETVLAFVRKDNGKPCSAPDWFIEKLKTVFNQSGNR